MQQPQDSRAPEVRALRIFVSGWVQGVGFRDFTCRVARRLGLAGFVRNLPDGRVEVRVQGEPARLEELVAALRRGPPGARVEGLESRPEVPTGQDWGFEIRYV